MQMDCDTGFRRSRRASELMSRDVTSGPVTSSKVGCLSGWLDDSHNSGSETGTTAGKSAQRTGRAVVK